MKVFAPKPIQSLQAFMCHGSGRRPTGFLPLLCHEFTYSLFYIVACLILCMLLCSSVYAQDNSADLSPSKEKRLDMLFDRIIQTLPDNLKIKVDSATTIKTNRPPSNEKPRSIKDPKKNAIETASLNGLPEEVKAQVERAMAQMQERKQERKAQFLESRRKK
jgi:hypothetical protein